MSDTPERGDSAASSLAPYRVGMARIAPRVGASFASVFLRDPSDPRLLRLACAHNWPQSAARWLGEMRIMEGRGPTGRAVGRNRPVEVRDIFSDAALAEWWDPARELGFAAIIALPLARGGRPFGALSFYFAAGRTFTDDDRALLDRAARELGSEGLNAARSGPAKGCC